MKMPLKIALINMPFAMTCMPSLGLAQLESVLKSRFGDRVRVTTHYLNLDFAARIGDFDLYHHPYSPHGYMTDAGEWLFRHMAFPEAANNTTDYLDRYYFEDNTNVQAARKFLEREHSGLEGILEDLIDTHRLMEADIVGFTLLFSQTLASLALARLLKEKKPELVTIFGGSSCEGDMGQVLAERVPQVDYCFSGPALVSLPEFIRHQMEHDAASCERINGVFSKTNSRKGPDGSKNSYGPLGDELDINANIIPNYQPFLEAHDRLLPSPPRKPVLLLETSRGCLKASKRACRFCGLNGLNSHYRQMSPENAIRQIDALWNTVPQVYFFIAVDNLMPPSFPEKVFSKLTSPAGVAMRYEVRPDLTEGDLQNLCHGGVTWLQPGIEALSTSSLALMNKGGSAFRNLMFLKNCLKHPVTLEWNLLIGTPGESEAVYEKYTRDIPLMMHLAPPTGVYPIMFVKYSDYHNHPDQYGLVLKPQEVYSFIYPFAPLDLERVAYRYSDTKANPAHINEWLERLNVLVEHWRERWRGQDGKPAARLCMVESSEGASLYDTRSGIEVWHPLTPSAHTLLKILEKPASRDELRAHVQTDAEEVGSALYFLKERGLVFEEDGRFMSLAGN